MKKTTRAVSLILTGSMLMSLCSCSLGADKSEDDVLDMAEEVANCICDRDYKKLAKLTEDGDEDLEEMLEAIDEDDLKAAIASTLSFEFEEDSLEKDGKKGYTVEVTFTYVDYEEVVDGGLYNSVDEFEDAIDDCDKEVEEAITLEFEKDGDDIIFANISDLEALFPYWDEDIFADAIGNVEEAPVETEPAVTDVTDDTDPTETTEPSEDSDDIDLFGDDDEITGVSMSEGEVITLDDMGLAFTVPAGMVIDNTSDSGSIRLDGSVTSAGEGEMYNFYLESIPGFTYSPDFADYLMDAFETSLLEEIDVGETEYETVDRDYTIGGVTYSGRRLTFTYMGLELTLDIIYFGNDDCAYLAMVMSSDPEYISTIESSFSVV